MRKAHLTNLDLERAGIPERYWGVRLGNIPDTAAHKVEVTNYLAKLDELVPKGIGLFLWSKENSTGKTAIACMAGIKGMMLGYSVLFITAEDLKEAMLNDERFDEHSSVVQRAKNVDLMILDDLGKEYKGSSGFSETRFENLLRYRIQRNRATVVTSNLRPNQIGSIYAVDLAEVMKEALYGVEVVGEDRGGKNWRNEKALEIRRILRNVAA